MARRISVEIVGDDRQLSRTFGHASRTAQDFGRNIDKAGRGALAGSLVFRGLGRSVAFASASFLGGAGFAAALRSSIGAASDLNEEVSKSRQIFGASAKVVRDWSKTSAEALKIPQVEALQFAGALGAMLKTAGVVGPQLADMSKTLVQLGADMASFNNADPTDMLERLRSGLAGEAEPLRRFGVLLSESRVKQEAVRLGLVKNTKNLTEQQKVLARYSLILKDTADQQGDVARTGDALAGQQRELRARVIELEASIGTALLPAVNDLVTAINDWLGSTKNQHRIQQDLKTAIHDTAVVAETLRKVLKAISEITPDKGSLIALLLGLGAARRFIPAKGAAAAAGGGGLGAGEAALAGGTLGLAGGAAARRIFRGGTKIPMETGTFQFGLSGGAKAESQLIRIKRELIGLTAAKFIIPVALDIQLSEKVGIRTTGDLGEDLRAGRIKDFLLGPGASIHKGLLGRIFGPEDAKPKAATGEKRAIDNETRNLLSLTASFKRLEAVEKVAAAAAALARQARIRRIELERQWFDTRISRALNRVQDIASLQGQLHDLDRIAALLQQQIEKTKDITRKANLEDELLDVRRQQKGIREQAAQDFMDSLMLGVEMAQATQALGDDLRALERVNAELRRRVGVEGKTVELERQLFENEQQIREVRQERARRAAEARETRQFRALGLGPGGSELTPSLKGLRKELASVDDAIKGSILDTGKTRSLLSQIRRLLSGALGQLSRDVRLKIKEMLDDLDRQLRDEGGRTGPAKFKRKSLDALLSGLGLTPDQERALRARLSQQGVNGKSPTGGPNSGAFGMDVPADSQVNVHTVVELDGRVVARSTTQQQQRRKRRNPSQKRGAQAGK